MAFIGIDVSKDWFEVYALGRASVAVGAASHVAKRGSRLGAQLKRV
jgi:hypothetical protein